MKPSPETIAIQPEDLSSVALHRLLLSAIAPRPIAFASTIDRDGRVNLSPFSYFNVFSTRPPVCIFSPSRRVQDNTEKHTLQNVREVPEVCISVVNRAMTQQMSLASSNFPKGVDEFVKAGFTPRPSDRIRPPGVMESPVSLECRVDEIRALGSEGGAGNLIFCTVLRVHVQKQVMRDDGSIDSLQLDLVGRMGEDWYCHADRSSMFRVPKPGAVAGVGIDGLPEYVRHSKWLTGNDLGKLGHIASLPDASAVKECREGASFRELLRRVESVGNGGQRGRDDGDRDGDEKGRDDSDLDDGTGDSGSRIRDDKGRDDRRQERLREHIHKHAKGLIEENQLIDALVIMMAIEENF